MTDGNTVNAAMKQKGEDGGDYKSTDERESSECISHNMVLQCVDTVLKYMGQRGFEYSDITATRKIRTIRRRRQRRQSLQRI
jgi:hypothetical protein